MSSQQQKQKVIDFYNHLQQRVGHKNKTLNSNSMRVNLINKPKSASKVERQQRNQDTVAAPGKQYMTAHQPAQSTEVMGKIPTKDEGRFHKRAETHGIFSKFEEKSGQSKSYSIDRRPKTNHHLRA